MNMRYFSLIDFQYWVLALFLGLISAIVVYMAWGSYPLFRRKRTAEELKEESGHELSGGHGYEENPAAPLVIAVYIGVIAWTILYIIFIGILGGPIG